MRPARLVPDILCGHKGPSGPVKDNLRIRPGEDSDQTYAGLTPAHDVRLWGGTPSEAVAGTP